MTRDPACGIAQRDTMLIHQTCNLAQQGDHRPIQEVSSHQLVAHQKEIVSRFVLLAIYAGILQLWTKPFPCFDRSGRVRRDRCPEFPLHYEGYPLVALCNLKGIERLTL